MVKLSPKICEKIRSKIKTKEQDHLQNSLDNEVRVRTIVELSALYGKMLLARIIENYQIYAYFSLGYDK